MQPSLIRQLSALALAAAALAGASPSHGGAARSLPLIPRPVSAERQPGGFALADGAKLFLPPSAGADWRAPTEFFAAQVKSRFGISLAIQESTASDCAGVIAVGPAAKACSKPAEAVPTPTGEGYTLAIGDGAMIQAATPHGLHNALMTLLQLIGAGEGKTGLPGAIIADRPRFAWRGLLLDSARSFHPPNVIKKYLDLMAEHKLTVLHWHLVDDQGWRIESLAFPKLHEVGGVLAPLNEKKKAALDKNGWGRTNRGYYTQAELRELVAYAAARQIMIVPEIDVPGHSSAMLAAYPELSCSGQPIEVRGTIGIFRTALCPGKEEVYAFLETLFGELAAIFPAPYVHIGSDEVMAGDWLDYPPHQQLMAERGYTDKAGLQSYFVERVQKILERHGKTMIAWDEVTAYAPPGSVVQAWRRHDYARRAAEAGRDSVVSPVSCCYIDYPQLQFTLKNLYGFEPIPAGLAPELGAHVLGGEINLWGERVTLDNMDEKVFPRLLAHAEVQWSPAEGRDWRDFQARLGPVQKNLAARGVDFGLTWNQLWFWQ